MLATIADQVQIPASAFSRYGDRDHTLYEHLDEIRQTYHFRECGWKEYLWLARELLPLALESDRPLLLIEHALELLRTQRILPPGFLHLERFTWIILKAAERRLYRFLTSNLTLEHRAKLDSLLHSVRGWATRYHQAQLVARTTWTHFSQKCQADCRTIALLEGMWASSPVHRSTSEPDSSTRPSVQQIPGPATHEVQSRPSPCFARCPPL